MQHKYIEFVITSDTSALDFVSPHRGMIRADQIVGVSDISGGGFGNKAMTEITLDESADYPLEDEETGGSEAVHSKRKICVQMCYEELRELIYQ